MTDIQVKYWANKENEKHNREMERQNLIALSEQKRHNQATEYVSSLQANAALRQAEVADKNSAINLINANTKRTEAHYENAVRQAKVADYNASAALKYAQKEDYTASTDLKKAQKDAIVAGMPSIEAQAALDQAGLFWNSMGSAGSTLEKMGKGLGAIVKTLDTLLSF